MRVCLRVSVLVCAYVGKELAARVVGPPHDEGAPIDERPQERAHLHKCMRVPARVRVSV